MRYKLDLVCDNQNDNTVATAGLHVQALTMLLTTFQKHRMDNVSSLVNCCTWIELSFKKTFDYLLN